MVHVVARVLGPIGVEVNGRPVDLGGPRQRRLLAALLVNQGTVMSTDWLIDATFAGAPPRAASRTFRTYVARLRRALEVAGLDPSVIVVTSAPGYVIPHDVVELDANTFEEQVASAQDHLSVGQAENAVLMLADGLELWGGEPYAEFADEQWARAEARRLQQVHLNARELRAEAMVESGSHVAAVPEIEALIHEEPFREGPRRLLSLALYRAGRHAEAIRSLRQFKQYLAEETGLEPSAELHEMEQLVLERDPRLEVRPTGQKLRGYLLKAPLYESALGVTYRASQPSVGREVAITAIDESRSNDPEFIRRFEVHAQRIASIEHPNVVVLHDFWRQPDRAYLVTQLHDSDTLDRRLAAGEISVGDLERVLLDVGRALAAIHERGITHGRVSASNVSFDATGAAVLGGFGFELVDQKPDHDLVELGRLGRSALDRVVRSSGDGRDDSAKASRLRQILERTETDQRQPGYESAAAFVAALGSRATHGAGATTETVPAPTIEGPNPYQGLYAFAESDADVFFGRDRLVQQMLDHLDRSRFLAVVGASGTGKSSAVRAGLLPKLRAQGNFIATMTPSQSPVAELELALSRVASSPIPDLGQLIDDDRSGLAQVVEEIVSDHGQRLILLIDQLEELFVASEPEERGPMFEALDLAVAAGHLTVVVTIRADFVGVALGHPNVGPMVRDNAILVSPLDHDELYAAIVGPAEKAGVIVEPTLAADLVGDGGSAPGALPLLQYSLTELYEHRQNGVMTLETYRRFGGLTGVLTQRADEIYTSLDADERVAAQRLFTRLIAPGEGAEDTRIRVKRSDLVGVSDELLASYGSARLLTFDRDGATREPTVEIAHESLIGDWSRLRDWIDDDRDGIRMLRRVSAAAAEWDGAGRSDDGLYRGARLAGAADWAAEHPADLTPLEVDFIEASRSNESSEIEVERRRASRLRSLLIGLAVVTALALVAGLQAFVQQRSAEANATEADLRRLVLESQSTLAEDRGRGLLLAAEAYHQDPSPDTLGAVQQVIAGLPQGWLGDIRNGRPYNDVRFLSDGALVAVGDERLEVWDVEQRQVLRQSELPASVTTIDVDHSDNSIAVAMVDGSWMVVDGETLAIKIAGQSDALITVIDLAADHELLGLGLESGGVELLDLTKAPDERLLVDATADGAVSSVAISQDGGLMAAAAGLGTEALQWDSSTGQRLGPAINTDSGRGVDYLAYQGDVLYVIGEEVEAFDSQTARRVGPVVELSGRVFNARAEGSSDNGVRIIGEGIVAELSRGGTEVEFFPHETSGGPSRGAVSPDGNTTAHALADGISFWALDGAGLAVDVVLPAVGAEAFLHNVSHDGATLIQSANASSETPSRIWNLSGAAPSIVHEQPAGQGMRMTGNHVVRYGPDADPMTAIEFQRWDPVSKSFKDLASVAPASRGSTMPAFTPDGGQFVHPWNNGGGVLEIWDVESAQQVVQLTSFDEAPAGSLNYATSPVFTPDGQFLVLPTETDYVAIYRVGTWERVELLDPSEGFGAIAFSPDGTSAFTHSGRGLERRDAVDLRKVIAGPVPGEINLDPRRGIEITADGRYLKTSSSEGPRMWDASSLQPIGGPFPQDAGAGGGVLAAETNQLTSIVDGRTVIWDVELEKWPELACLAAGRNLSQAEWERFGPDRLYSPTCPQWESS